MIKRLLKRFIFRLRADFTTEDLVKRGLKVGKNFLRMHGTILDPSHCWLISIGDNVTLAPRVHILRHDASTCYPLGYARIGKVNIGNNVFIGADSVVLPNVTIGDNVIVGANSTVTKNIPSNSIACGSPARVIESYDDFVDRNKVLMSIRPCYSDDFTLRKNITKEMKNKQYEDLDNGIGFLK